MRNNQNPNFFAAFALSHQATFNHPNHHPKDVWPLCELAPTSRRTNHPHGDPPPQCQPPRSRNPTAKLFTPSSAGVLRLEEAQQHRYTRWVQPFQPVEGAEGGQQLLTISLNSKHQTQNPKPRSPPDAKLSQPYPALPPLYMTLQLA